MITMGNLQWPDKVLSEAFLLVKRQWNPGGNDAYLPRSIAPCTLNGQLEGSIMEGVGAPALPSDSQHHFVCG